MLVLIGQICDKVVAEIQSFFIFFFLLISGLFCWLINYINNIDQDLYVKKKKNTFVRSVLLFVYRIRHWKM